MEAKSINIDSVVEFVRSRLAEICEERKVPLEMAEEDHQLEDDWLYLAIATKEAGVRASDYASIMAEIEKELHQQGIDNVLLIPVVPD